MTVPEGHRFEATQALRQVLGRAVTWRIIEQNPATVGVENPARRRKEMRPFESWAEVEAVATRLGPVYGPMLVFAAATGLSARGVDRARAPRHRPGGPRRPRSPLLLLRSPETVRRPRPACGPCRYSGSRSRRSRAAPQLESRCFFHSPRGGYLDLHNFRARVWKRAQLTAGIEPLGGPMTSATLRHLRPPSGAAALRSLPLPGHEPDHGRPPLRPPRPRRARARDHAARRARSKRRRLAGVDSRWTPPAPPREPKAAGNPNEQGLSQEPTLGLQPRTPSLRVKCSTS